jgi:hypothetical protein
MREARRFRSVILRASIPWLLAAVLVFPVRAAETTPPGSAGAPAKPAGTTAKPADKATADAAKSKPAASTTAAEMQLPPDSVPCEAVADAILQGEDGRRIDLSESAIRRGCRPVPAPTWSAVRYGRWTDERAIDARDRSALLGLMAAARYPEAETLAVELLQNGRWPEGSSLDLQQGSLLIQGLKSDLTKYRIHLLLDIYEQQREPVVRMAVLQSLSNSNDPEALIPAVDACLADSGQVRSVALGVISAQPEKTAEGVLARLIGDLPDGPTLAWARNLGQQHPSEAVSSALKKRGPSKAG